MYNTCTNICILLVTLYLEIYHLTLQFILALQSS